MKIDYKINLSKLLFCVCMAALCEPMSLYNSFLHPLFSLGKIIALFYSVYLVISKKVILDKFLWLVIIYFIFLIIPTLINGGNLRVWFMSFYMYTSACVLVKYGIKRDSRFIIKVIASIFSFILLINLISFLQNGVDYAIDSSLSIQYFIGIRTRIGDIAYAAYSIVIIGAIQSKNNIKLQLIVTFLSALYFIVFNDVSTGLLCSVIYVSVLFLGLKFKNFMKHSFLVAFIASVLLSAGVIIYHIQDKFAWLIEGILHESITMNGRSIIWNSVLAQMPGHWLFGQGLGVEKSFKLIYGDVGSTHNQFLDVLYSGGIIALIIFLLIVLEAMIKLTKCRQRLLLCVFGSSMLAYSFAMITEIVCSNTYFYIFLALCSYADNIKLINNKNKGLIKAF